jgi:hypothetical protein
MAGHHLSLYSVRTAAIRYSNLGTGRVDHSLLPLTPISVVTRNGVDSTDLAWKVTVSVAAVVHSRSQKLLQIFISFNFRNVNVAHERARCEVNVGRMYVYVQSAECRNGSSSCRQRNSKGEGGTVA